MATSTSFSRCAPWLNTGSECRCAVSSLSEYEEGTVSSLSAGLETLVIGTAKAVDEGTVSSLSAGPETLAIGTAKAFAKGLEYHYRKGRVGEEFVYRCTKGSEFSLAGEILYILWEDGYYVAYDAHINADQRLVLRQPVFRTKDILCFGYSLLGAQLCGSRVQCLGSARLARLHGR